MQIVLRIFLGIVCGVLFIIALTFTGKSIVDKEIFNNKEFYVDNSHYAIYALAFFALLVITILRWCTL